MSILKKSLVSVERKKENTQVLREAIITEDDERIKVKKNSENGIKRMTVRNEKRMIELACFQSLKTNTFNEIEMKVKLKVILELKS